MAEEQNEFGVPIGKNEKRRSARLLPRYFRTEPNKKLLQATIDQLTQSGTVKRINGYIGRQNAKAVTGNDVFLQAPTDDRQSYQLEPSLVSRDDLGNVNFFKDYIDYINSISVLGGDVSNHQRINEAEIYSWDPHINWDKAVNFQQYYWLPYGPNIIEISGQQQNVISTYTVELSDEGDNRAYLFTPNGLTRNPNIRLYRGQTYRFEINCPGEPFSIKTQRSFGSLNRYVPGVSEHAVEVGTVVFTIPEDCPDILYYVSENSIDTGGSWQIFDIDENTEIDVENEIIGKKTYTMSNGVALSNGMKVSFKGVVTPEEYAIGSFYVEGVGDSIKLISETSLEVITGYSDDLEVLFDDAGFDSQPFSEATTYANKKDYITINRSNTDGNPWSRYNRWFHQDVITTSAEIAGQQPVLDQAQRATRPIIEFESNLKLFNFGTVAKQSVDLVDLYTTDVFSIIEGSTGYNIDGVALASGQRILFLADTDVLVRNKIYRVEFLNLTPPSGATRRQIHLVEETDAEPLTNQCVLVRNGLENQGKNYWFDGDSWVEGQEKTAVNQSPLFDLFDSQGIGLTDSTKYSGSTFSGNKVFSYKIGSSVADSELGFSLSYRNINNIGDIVFSFNLSSDEFSYKNVAEVITEKTDSKFLKKITGLTTGDFVNAWTKNIVENVQPIVRTFKKSNLTDVFPVDVYDNISDLADLKIKVFLNGKRLFSNQYSVEDGPIYKNVVLETAIGSDDVLTLKCYAKQSKNDNGYYELPINFQNNPLNNNINTFTLGEVIDHVDTIVNNVDEFSGVYPGSGNLRDISELSSYGTRFVQHAGPANFSLYHLTSKNANVIKAIEQARDDYNKFKHNFINIATKISDDISVKELVDRILFEINKDKPKLVPYYFSDLLAYGAATKTDFEVVDYRITTYPLSEVFSLDEISNKAVNVYLNDVQLIYGKDYLFSDEGFVDISATLENGDIVTVYEYESTDGSRIPATPTTMGMWPKFEPRKYLDTSFLTPQNVIQGHDGSIVLAYNDYRDDLLLELEKRIFNNIKVNYDPDIVDIYDFIPGYNREVDYSLEEFNKILAPSFYKWTTFIDRDFTKPLTYSQNSPFTFNYSSNYTVDGQALPGFWRGIYKWIFDTDRIHLCPWESLGFSLQPSWWEEVYGPAPYTGNNLILWNDLKEGIIREPNKPVIRNSKFARPILETNIPVDESGMLLDPIAAGLVQGYVKLQSVDDFVFGDVSPVESAWRRSSYYPFSVLISMILMKPNKVIGAYIDRSRVVKNLASQFVYSETNLRARLKDLEVPSTPNDDERIITAGLINYVVDYILSDNLKSLEEYKNDLQILTNYLSHRLGAFTSKEKYKLVLDSKSPVASAGVFVPSENYNIFLNTSSPIKKLTYSGVIVSKVLTKYGSGFEIKGYSQTQPFFYYYPWTQSGQQINVGGISESYIDWTAGQQYVAGNIIKNNNVFYRVKTTHTASANFDNDFYIRLPALPIIGGRDAVLRKKWDRSPKVLNYGTTFKNIQDVVDFLQGYGEYLKDQGFVFDDYNTTLKEVSSWETSIKEFLFWTTQNWSTGEDKYVDWLPENKFEKDEIVIYNGDYYRSNLEHTSGLIFDESLYVKLDGLSQSGASVISLSPAALGISLKLDFAVIDDLRDPFNEYEIFRENGQKFDQNFLNYTREDNTFSFSPRVDGIGIYGATFYLVQKEHVVIIDNITQFNDVIYDLEAGYRQERIKVNGYRTTDWYGGFDIPGFIYDSAKIADWAEWTDYNLGDIVKYKAFYYSAKTFLPGVEKFNFDDWIILDQKPESELLPNWDYKAEQFTDFYDLESDNFDAGQQKVAQHLIGYQKRQYLENIIQNDVSEFKFYQGMIPEKGTTNVLNKLFDVLSAADKDSLDFNEEWALRLGQYGAADAFEEIEFILDESKFKSNPQAFELVSTVDNNLVDFVIRQAPSSIYVKPADYNNNPWPVNYNFTPYLRSPGYVRYDQVALNIDSLDDVLTKNVNDFSDGDYVWCAFQGSERWQVQRFTLAEFFVQNVEYNTAKKLLKIVCDKAPSVTTGDIIGIKKYDIINGFHKVLEVSGVNIFVSVDIPGWAPPYDDISNAVLYKFSKQRFSSIDDVTLPKVLKSDELLWTDESGNGKYAVWKNSPVFDRTKVYDDQAVPGVSFGKSTALDAEGKTLVVSSDNEILVYKRANNLIGWVRDVGLPIPDFVTNYGQSVALSDDSEWLAIGAPFEGNVKTKFVGTYSLSGSYSDGDIVKLNYAHFSANGDVVGDGSSISSFSQDWNPVQLIEIDETAAPSGLTNQGLVLLYQKDPNNEYIFHKAFISPDPSSNEKFGSKIKFARSGSDYSLIISGPGHNSDQGRVYLFKYNSSESTWKMDYDRRYRGEYNVGYQYFADDIVSSSYKLYQCIESNTGESLTNIAYWKIITDKNVYGYFPSPVVEGADDGLPIIGDGSTAIDGLGDSSIQYAENIESVSSNSFFGHDFDVSADGSIIVIGAPGADSSVYDNYRGPFKSDADYRSQDVVLYSGAYYKAITDFNDGDAGTVPTDPTLWILLGSVSDIDSGKVFVYKRDEDSFDLTQTLGRQNVSFESSERFGESVAIANDGNVIAVGSVLADDSVTDQGVVRVFETVDDGSTVLTYNILQTIKNRNPETNERFGSKVNFINNGESLVVFAAYGDSSDSTIFDYTSGSNNNDSGRIDVYDRYYNNYIFAESLSSESVSSDIYGFSISAANNVIVSSAINTTNNFVNSGAVYSYIKSPGTFSWSKAYEETDKIDLKKIKKLFLYNKKTNKLVTYLDVIDPIQGRIAGPAEQEIKYKTYHDPATYSVGTGAVNVDDGMAWLDTKVGTLWWDLSRAKFLDTYIGDTVYKNSIWNTLYDTGSIDIYEWVESKLTPEQWDEQADTEAGLSNGISGQSLYGNAVYSIKRKYDTVSKAFKNTYYFWVKNKTITPNVIDRSLSASDVSSLIADPKGQGLKYIEFTGTNSFSLVNVEDLLINKEVVLVVQYWLVDQDSLNVHTDWKIVSENIKTNIPAVIETKWIDSLIGTDENNNPVPDLNLPPKQRYGIQFRPRQAMFVNRIEAIKQFIERLNSEISSILLVDSADLSDLNSSDPLPTTISGLYDYVIDADNELRFVNVGAFRKPVLEPLIEDGKIVGVDIIDSGSGFVYAPYLTITGSGKDARLKAVIDTNGRIVDVNIIDKGYGYNEVTTIITVRTLSTLVRSDSQALGRWTIYSYDTSTAVWSRTKTQSYDVTQFWDYKDWYDTGYNQFVKIDHIVDGTYQLFTLDSEIGQLVKVKNVGSAGWMILEKIADVKSIDYTLSYKVVGRQNGTIQISDKFYNYSGNNLGYDGPLYDADTYDNSGALELRVILNALKDKILIDDLKSIYLRLFFAALKYVLHEQTFVDWAFKTSFVKATHNVGDLEQKVTYNNDNLIDYENYISEVKPYRTKVREYLSSYSSLDNSQSMITDFDLPPVIRGNTIEPLYATVSNNSITSADAEISQYPWKHWLDAVGFKVHEIVLVDGGSGYINKPVVNIIGESTTPATARAYVSNGRVTKIEILTNGSGYFSAPIVELSGGLSVDGTPASAVAIIKNDQIRSNLLKIKFDRISKSYFITDLNSTETFSGTGSQRQFQLKWSPDTNIGNTVITINGQEALKDTYTISTKKTTTRGYTAYSGLLTFTFAPESGDEIVINYVKDFNYLSAADRINYYYNPVTGQIGKDFAQLMTGVDYGGVNIVGLDFKSSSGWDELPWFSDVWDAFDPTFDDYIVTVDDSTYSFQLPYVPAAGQEINVYVNGIRIDDPYFDLYDGSTVQPNGRLVAPASTVMKTIVGDGVTSVIELPNLTSTPILDINAGDQIIFRKSTSDGSRASSVLDYDTSISGGDMAYSTATGLNAEDIIIDGDGFVTPTTSNAPEEVVPGQLTDAVAIRVYHRPTSGSAKVICKNYIGNGVETNFKLEQYPNTQEAVIVKVDQQILQLNVDYVVDYDTKSVDLTSAPADKSLVSVISFGYNGEDIADLDYFVGDGSTIEFITKAPWNEDATSLVVVSGVAQDYILFRTDETYESLNKIGIRFGSAPEENSIINYLISESLDRTFSLSTKETIVSDGSTLVYPLTNSVGNDLPLEKGVIVKKGNYILSGPDNTYYTLSDDNLRYKIPPNKFQADLYDINDFEVYLDNELLSLMTQYILDLTTGEVILNRSVYADGKRLIISIVPLAEYRITESSGVNSIEFTTVPSLGEEIEIMSMFNHNVLDIEKTDLTIALSVDLVQDSVEYFEYNQITGKNINLGREVLDDSYVMIVKNNVLLTHSVDYKLLSSSEIKLEDSPIITDKFTIITFSNNVVRPAIGYMQFKDMLNRDHYKRLSKDKSTKLVANLNYYDSQIIVENTDVLTTPNKNRNLPGIVYINGERIEFFVKTGNVLSQLRRGTLGTGTPAVHPAGSVLMDIGVTETIPYTDDIIVDTYYHDGSTNIVPLQYTPQPTSGTIDDGSTGYTGWVRNSIPSQFGQCDEIEVFVGGYNIKGSWQENTSYSSGEIVIYGSYTYRCVQNHLSTDSFTEDRDYWEYFVGNQRLKKHPYQVHNQEIHNESTEGDVEFEADFSVDGTSKAVRLTNDLTIGTKVVVVKKIGKVWNDPGKSLIDSTNKIASFLKNSTTLFPK